MTYHSANGRLMCHYCGHSQPETETCPECGGRMKHIGAGTQKVEEELRELFPEADMRRFYGPLNRSAFRFYLERRWLQRDWILRM